MSIYNDPKQGDLFSKLLKDELEEITDKIDADMGILFVRVPKDGGFHTHFMAKNLNPDFASILIANLIETYGEGILVSGLFHGRKLKEDLNKQRDSN